jgi:hypothetical protein
MSGIIFYILFDMLVVKNVKTVVAFQNFVAGKPVIGRDVEEYICRFFTLEQILRRISEIFFSCVPGGSNHKLFALHFTACAILFGTICHGTSVAPKQLLVL